MTSSHIIRARRLAKAFGQKRGRPPVDAVRGVDFDVDEGEIVGFLGPNGAGKTTTLRMLTTLLRPTAGRATIAGHDLIRNPAGVRRNIGYVAQRSGTAPESTIGEELELQGRLYGLTKAEARRRGAHLVDELDLHGCAARPTKTLSGGQRRRLDIALGLIHAPRLVFLDEPSTGLDPESRANLCDHITRLRTEKAMTVFLTTHYLDEVDLLADRVLVIDQGTIVATGTPETLKSTLSGDGISITVAEASVPTAATLVSNYPDASQITLSPDTVGCRVRHGATAVPRLVKALERHHVEVKSITVTRPSLDDVFFAITGRRLRESANVPYAPPREQDEPDAA
jgi:ABC-2 type transport system ATP-binding protein